MLPLTGRFGGRRSAAGESGGRSSGPRSIIGSRLGSSALRANIHLAIWVVFAFAFLPLYLMLIVSQKTNRQFYTSSATVTQPLHFGNWVEAWNLVAPSVPNGLFISISTTVLTVFIARAGAYFFARPRMPLAGPFQ